MHLGREVLLKQFCVLFMWLCVVQAAAVCTPRTHAWLCNVACLLPKDQANKVTSGFLRKSYTSVNIIYKKDACTLLEQLDLESLKAGTKLVLTKKLEELEVLSMLTLVYSDAC